MAKTFREKLDDAKKLGVQVDAANEEIVEEFITTAAPVIQMLRDISENMSPDISFSSRSRQVLTQIDSGLLRDPLSVRVLEKVRKDKEAAVAAETAEPPSGEDDSAEA